MGPHTTPKPSRVLNISLDYHLLYPPLRIIPGIVFFLREFPVNLFSVCKCDKCNCFIINDYSNPIISNANAKCIFVASQFFQGGYLIDAFCITNSLNTFIEDFGQNF